MTPGAIEGSNLLLKGTDGVQDLPAFRTDEHIVTAWYPTPVELDYLNLGMPAYLFVLSERHPPVMLGVKAP